MARIAGMCSSGGIVRRHLRSLVAVLVGLAATSGFIAAGGAARADATGVVSVVSVPGYGGFLTTAAGKVYLAPGSSPGILVFNFRRHAASDDCRRRQHHGLVCQPGR